MIFPSLHTLWLNPWLAYWVMSRDIWPKSDRNTTLGICAVMIQHKYLWLSTQFQSDSLHKLRGLSAWANLLNHQNIVLKLLGMSRDIWPTINGYFSNQFFYRPHSGNENIAYWWMQAFILFGFACVINPFVYKASASIMIFDGLRSDRHCHATSQLTKFVLFSLISAKSNKKCYRSKTPVCI